MSGPTPRDRRALTVGLLAAALVMGLGHFAGGTLREIALGGIEVLPIAVFGVVAQLGRRVVWARVVAWVLAALALVGASLALSGLALTAWEGQRASAAVSMAILAALLLTAASAGPPGALLARRLSLRAHDPVHRQALLLALGIVFLGLAPLVGSGGQALLLEIIRAGTDFDFSLSALDHLAPLAWVGPAAFALVGYGLHRGWPATIDRLGLRWSGPRDLVWGLGAGLALVPAALIVGGLLQKLFEIAGVPVAPDAELEQLFGLSTMTVGTALALSVAAGVGEELAIRGVLQPRLGLWLSSLVFAALHALQYSWDGVLVVWLLGIAFGVLRRRTNTVVSMIAHAVYDFALLGLLIGAGSQ